MIDERFMRKKKKLHDESAPIPASELGYTVQDVENETLPTGTELNNNVIHQTIRNPVTGELEIEGAKTWPRQD